MGNFSLARLDVDDIVCRNRGTNDGDAMIHCPYCNTQAKLVDGTVIYPHRHDLSNLNFWHCAACDAYVGCHKAGIGYGDGTRPLGTMANAALRTKRSEAHRLFDALWHQTSNRATARSNEYALLAEPLGIDQTQRHIAMFDTERCQQVNEYVYRTVRGRMRKIKIAEIAKKKGINT